MASRSKTLVGHILGRKLKNPGSVLYHAADGVADGGFYNADQRHRLRKALHKERTRPSGMTDDIDGSKEVGGTNENPYEADE